MRLNIGRRFTGVALTALIAGCSDGGTPTQLHPGLMAPAFQQTQNQVDDAEFGFTAGWLHGQTVQFFYHKPFFCRTPVEDGNPVGATTACEVGSDGSVDPRLGNIPILYVMTPIGFRPTVTSWIRPRATGGSSTSSASRIPRRGTRWWPGRVSSRCVRSRPPIRPARRSRRRS